MRHRLLGEPAFGPFRAYFRPPLEVVVLICAFRSLGKARRSSSAVLETFAAYAWAEVALYMSSGRIYYAALLLATLCFPMMLLALKKEVAKG